MKLLLGDCVKRLKELESESIDMVLTSPPYDDMDENFNPIPKHGLRKYNSYAWDFKGLAHELFRVLKQGGVLVWVVNDLTINGSESLASSLQKIYFRRVGFNIHDTMIYAKINPVPLTHNRYEQQFEYVFVLSKGKPKVFNPSLQSCKTAGNVRDIKRNRPYDAHAQRHYRSDIIKTKSSKYLYNIWFYSIGTNKNKFNLHSAVFPERLAEDHIISWSNPGDVILDPMMGSGTTGEMAIKNARDFIGIEISDKYFKTAEERIKSIMKSSKA